MYPQPLMTAAATYDGNGLAHVTLGGLDLAEDHLRGLGWRVVCTIQGEGKFLTSTTTATTVVKNVPYETVESREGQVGPPVPPLNLVGPPKATAVVIANVSLLYKPQI